MKHFLIGLIAGAVGTTVLNLVTYVDMLIRGRPASSMPAEVAGAVADRMGWPIEENVDPQQAEHRKEGLGALMGIGNGLLIGGLFGLVRPLASGVPTLANAIVLGGLAMAASDVPATKLGKTDPSEWSTASWVSDVVPHLLYGLATVVAFDGILSAWRERESEPAPHHSS